jgi:esterase/lipase
MFKAATYFRTADFFLHGNPSDPRINSLWDQQTAAFDKALSLTNVPGKRKNLNGCNFSIPTIFYAAENSAKRRPTIIIGNGYDGSQEEAYHLAGKAALERGYNVITYEGPGQPTVRREQNLGFIPNWEAVVTPVVDYLVTLPEVDPSAIAILGISFGGYLAPRAAAFEHRLAAVICLDGVYDFSTVWFDNLGPEATEVFKSGNKTAFDTGINAYRAAPDTPTTAKWAFDQGLWSFNTSSPFDFVTETQAYTLEGVVDQITVPVFVGDAEGDLFFKGQPQLLADKLGNRSTYHSFKDADGSGAHSGVGAFVFQNEVVFDWFQNIVGGKN